MSYVSYGVKKEGEFDVDYGNMGWEVEKEGGEL